jgi:hypothetical protein
MNNDNGDVGNTQPPLGMHSEFDQLKFSFHLFSFFIREVIFHVITLRKKIHIMFSFASIEVCLQLVGIIVYSFRRETTVFAM